MVRVKICGITSAEDARLAAACGADAIGVLVGRRHPSADFVSPQEAHAILAGLPPFVAGTLVTHEADAARVGELIALVRPSVVQLHSDMPPADCATLKAQFGRLSFFKSFHVVGPESLQCGDRYLDVVDGFHLDSTSPSTGQVGGTGLIHDWNISTSIVQRYRLPVVLAGGLTPANVAAAIVRVKPFAVDVNSGVKAGKDRRQDVDKVRDFIRRAKTVGAI